ncbi:type IV pilus assembly protein PilZ [Leptospira fainei serovar Hurstbridge str. BUT 6]|uniref:Type IV pilus assembly protein PilZ n=1 Tax=Leptospira fainei serovar Hurstbridge str. BUT 6 TaxID=1193011 RepID=S3VGG3_9LEPT|nr:PilZ domain-containing protein [Leptospira fainei]EPG75530.1 type IV pilus assembly protein PilZ [Leptospira fainei serovar Hurstbridge str. BUT 6]
MAEERRRGERIVSKELFELLVLAMHEKGAVVGNVLDISDFGIAILTDLESMLGKEIGSKITGMVSGPSMEDIQFAGVVIRIEKVATSKGFQGMIGVEFYNQIPLSDRVIALSLTALN